MHVDIGALKDSVSTVSLSYLVFNLSLFCEKILLWLSNLRTSSLPLCLLHVSMRVSTEYSIKETLLVTYMYSCCMTNNQKVGG